jgi:uncharacterized membrane protein
MERQGRQTAQLLQLVQEQRRALEEANGALREELDGIYAASLASHAAATAAGAIGASAGAGTGAGAGASAS